MYKFNKLVSNLLLEFDSSLLTKEISLREAKKISRNWDVLCSNLKASKLQFTKYFKVPKMKYFALLYDNEPVAIAVVEVQHDLLFYVAQITSLVSGKEYGRKLLNDLIKENTCPMMYLMSDWQCEDPEKLISFYRSFSCFREDVSRSGIHYFWMFNDSKISEEDAVRQIKSRMF